MDSIIVGAGGLAAGAALDKVSDADMLSLLREIRDELVAQSHYADVERQRTEYPVILDPGSPHHMAQQGDRLTKLLVSGAPGDSMALMQGTRPLFTYINVSGDPVVLELPLLLSGEIYVEDRTDSSATNWRATLFYRQDVAMGISGGRNL